MTAFDFADGMCILNRSQDILCSHRCRRSRRLVLFFKREGSDGLMEIERAKQSFNTFFEDVFSARNIIETSLRFWKFILLLAVLGAVGATLLTMFVIRPSYTAQATLFAWRVDDAP